MNSMPQAAADDQESGRENEVVLGVDTHKEFHVAAVLTMLGSLVATRCFPATAAGYEQLLAWARSIGTVRSAGVECTGSYGAALGRYLLCAGVKVFEVNQSDRATRRRRGKSDEIDAEAAAAAVLSGRASAIAKAGNGPVEMLRIFRLAKSSAIKARTQTINQLKAVLVSAATGLRESLAGLSTIKLVRRCADLDAEASTGLAEAAVFTLRLLARRFLELSTEVRELERRISEVVARHRPQLLERRGVGPDNAAALLIAAGDNPERMRNEASFASLCGTSPVSASSGRTTRMRLNRGGNRQANAALYRITISRLRWDPATREYLARRITEGNPGAKPSVASNATSRARSTRSSQGLQPARPRRLQRLDIHRGIRLARSLPDARDIVAELTDRDVALSLGGSVHDPTDPVGRLLFNVLAMVAEFESDLARLRTREGIKVARAKLDL